MGFLRLAPEPTAPSRKAVSRLSTMFEAIIGVCGFGQQKTGHTGDVPYQSRVGRNQL